MYIAFAHGDHSVHIEKENVYCQGIACSGWFDLGLTSAEDQNLDCFKWTANNILIRTIQI